MNKKESNSPQPKTPKAFEETAADRTARLKRPIGMADVLLVKQSMPDIPDEFLAKIMFGGR